jgi:hypothetical protein
MPSALQANELTPGTFWLADRHPFCVRVVQNRNSKQDGR